jgi:hypothetical protein
MSLNIHEAIRFYEQKYHIAISLVCSPAHLNAWNEENILIGIPANAEKEIELDGMKMKYDPGFSEKLPGEVIKLEDVPIAKIGRHFIVFHFNPINAPAEDLVRQMIDKALPRLARNIRQQQLDSFMNSMKQLSGRICEERESAIQSKEWEIERYSKNIQDLAGEISSMRLMLQFFKKSEDSLRYKAVRMFVELKKLMPGLYSDICFSDNHIIGRTQPIIISYNDYDYRFNPYEVEFNIERGTIAINNSGNDVDDHIHPHVSGSNICWGNVGPLIQKMIGQMELHGLFSLVYQFLSSYNREDAYQRIERWNPDWEDEEEESVPYCVYCDDYGHEVEDCEYCWWCDECSEYHGTDEACPKHEEEELEEAA